MSSANVSIVIVARSESYFPWDASEALKSVTANFAIFSMAESMSVFFIGLEERI